MGMGGGMRAGRGGAKVLPPHPAVMDSLCNSWFPCQTLMLQISLILPEEQNKSTTMFGASCKKGKEQDSTYSIMFALLLSLISAILLPGSQTVKDPSSSWGPKTPGLEGTCPTTTELLLIEWIWDSEDEKKPILVSWKPNTHNPYWGDLEEKYKHTFSLAELAFLSIRNLNLGMNGLYTAKSRFHSGKSGEEDFRLCLCGKSPSPTPRFRLIHHPTHQAGAMSAWRVGPQEHREPDSDLAEQWSPQGAGAERDTGTGPQLRESKPETAPEPVEWPTHLCGQQPSGREECNLTPGEHLSMGRFTSEQLALERHPSHSSDERHGGGQLPFIQLQVCSSSPHDLGEDLEKRRAPGGRLDHEDTGAMRGLGKICPTAPFTLDSPDIPP
ncbi:hypothetical protein HPG69_006411 [Diceros bicornis minor]|uniref:Uncharacterized protein n=1 Tax=Diceros bicornis minor TaxID=77932 RepID=A0A7J7EWS0_DICBM|nr:hypothetical protein HPG69_006411 [Diceros bicornis minor]